MILRQVERVLPLHRGDPQLLTEHLLAGIVRQLQVVDAGHHGWQVVVGVDVGAVKCLLHDGQVRTESFESADRQARASGDKLQELTLLLTRVAGHHLVQHLDASRLWRVTVIRLATLGQALDIPRRVVRRRLGRAAKDLVELLGEEHLERCEREDGLKSLSQSLHLSVDTFDEKPVGDEPNVLLQVVDGHSHIFAALS